MTNSLTPESHEAAILHDAFAAYEQQADRLTESRARAGESAYRTGATPVRRRRMLLVAASVVGVAAVATGIALVEPGRGSDHVGTAAGGLASSVSTAGTASLAKRPGPAATASATASAPATPITRPPTARPVPSTRAEMIAAFKRVLGKRATFTVTESHGNYLKGILTAHGKQGGFDIQAADGRPGDTAFCEDAETSHCKITRTAAGGSLSTGHEAAGGGLLYLVNYVRPDGGSFLMHLSTLSDPKGGGTSLGSTPPLSIAQMAKILESPRW